MTTAAQMNTALGTTNDQLSRVGEYLDAVSPQFEADGETPRPNGVDDFRDHIVAHYTALYKAWKRGLNPDPEF